MSELRYRSSRMDLDGSHGAGKSYRDVEAPRQVSPRSLCVFCGSSAGASPEYAAAAERLGRTLADRRIGLVYGGAKVGLMRVVAETVLSQGGQVTGVIPKSLVDREVAFTELPDLRIVGSMHERKALMAELADGFIALPGGLGTIEEFFEVLTWGQLGMHRKPCGLLNIRRYFDPLIAFLNQAVSERFVVQDFRNMILIDESSIGLLEQFEAYQPPTVSKTRLALGFASDHDSR